MQKRELAAGIARGVEMTAIGCPFFNRCPMAIEGTCDTKTAPNRDLDHGHIIACHRTIEELNASEADTNAILGSTGQNAGGGNASA